MAYFISAQNCFGEALVAQGVDNLRHYQFVLFLLDARSELWQLAWYISAWSLVEDSNTINFFPVFSHGKDNITAV